MHTSTSAFLEYKHAGLHQVRPFIVHVSHGTFLNLQAEMVARDKEREKAKMELQAEAAKRNAEARLKAEARIAAALESNAAILARRRTEFDAKEKEAKARRQ